MGHEGTLAILLYMLTAGLDVRSSQNVSLGRSQRERCSLVLDLVALSSMSTRCNEAILRRHRDRPGLRLVLRPRGGSSQSC